MEVQLVQKPICSASLVKQARVHRWPLEVFAKKERDAQKKVESHAFKAPHRSQLYWDDVTCRLLTANCRQSQLLHWRHQRRLEGLLKRSQIFSLKLHVETLVLFLLNCKPFLNKNFNQISFSFFSSLLILMNLDKIS